MDEYRALFDLAGRTALVVGAASGIGEASAHALAAFGARVVCADLDGAGASGTAAAIGGEGGAAEGMALDVRDGAAVAAARDRVGTPDGLVVTPAVNVRKPLLAISDEEFDRVVDLNLKGTFRLLREFGGGMAERR